MTKLEHPASAPDTTRVSVATSGDVPSGSTGPTTREPPSDLDDLGWDVPEEEEGEDRDDANFDPDDDDDLEMEDEDDEQVGLDTESGFEDSPEDLELDDAGEGERWTTDSEAADDLPGTEGEVIDGQEYGWIGEDDAAGPEQEDELESDFDEGTPNLDDGGVEGVDDETDLEDFELGGLPELDSSAEEEGEGFGSESLEELAGVNLAEEPVLELVPGQPWKLLPPSALRTSPVATLPGAPLVMAGHSGRVVLCAGDGWYSAGRSGLSRLPVEASPGRGLALAEHEGRVVIVLGSPAGLYLSIDGGRSFERQRESDAPSEVAITVQSSRLRIWAKGTRGAVQTSDDLGKTWSPMRIEGQVITFATDGERRIAALVKRAGRTVLGISSDGGRRWSWADAAEGGEGGLGTPVPQLLPLRGGVLIADAKQVTYTQPGQAARRVAALLQAPAALLDEDDEVFVYASVPHEGRWLIIRSSSRAASQPLVLTSLGEEPRHVYAAFAEGGFVTLHVATDQALLRIEASLDGEDLP